MWDSIKGYILEILKGVALGIIDDSYWICLVVCLIALILYVAGQRKAGKYVSISFVIYFLLQSLSGVFR